LNLAHGSKSTWSPDLSRPNLSQFRIRIDDCRPAPASRTRVALAAATGRYAGILGRTRRRRRRRLGQSSVPRSAPCGDRGQVWRKQRHGTPTAGGDGGCFHSCSTINPGFCVGGIDGAGPAAGCAGGGSGAVPLDHCSVEGGHPDQPGTRSSRRRRGATAGRDAAVPVERPWTQVWLGLPAPGGWGLLQSGGGAAAHRWPGFSCLFLSPSVPVFLEQDRRDPPAAPVSP
jgi:hypothetical protein